MYWKSLLLTALAAAAIPVIADVNSARQPGKIRNGVLTDQKGMTLYITDRDKAIPGKSSCYGPCAANWPPLKASPKALASGDWSVITRKDGTKQWAFKGLPVYNWTHDRKPGDTTGDNFNHVWHVIKQAK